MIGTVHHYEESVNNIVYASQMSHNHILKLIGCCLETEVPIVVFEYFLPNNLADRICRTRQPQPERLSLTHRLKIAMDIAHAVAYIHFGFPRPIIIRDFHTSHIVFNEENVAKLFDFSFCISIPEGETHVTDDELVGKTMVFTAPEYFQTGVINEKCDVYSFGQFLVELMTGRDRSNRPRGEVDYPILDFSEKHRGKKILLKMVDRSIVEDLSCPQKVQQLQAFKQLTLECVNRSPEDRPTMVDVAKKLRQMYRSCM